MKRDNEWLPKLLFALIVVGIFAIGFAISAICIRLVTESDLPDWLKAVLLLK